MLLIYEPWLVRENCTLPRDSNRLHWAHRARRTCCVQSRAKLATKSPFYNLNIDTTKKHGPAAKLHVDECRPPHSRTTLSLCHQERITMTVRRIATQAYAHEHAQSLLVRPWCRRREKKERRLRWTRNPRWRHLSSSANSCLGNTIFLRGAPHLPRYRTTRLFFYYCQPPRHIYSLFTVANPLILGKWSLFADCESLSTYS